MLKRTRDVLEDGGDFSDDGGVAVKPIVISQATSQRIQHRTTNEIRFLNLVVLPQLKLVPGKMYGLGNNIIRASTIPQVFRLYHHYVTYKYHTGQILGSIDFEITTSKYVRFQILQSDIPRKLLMRLSRDLGEFDTFMGLNPWADIIEFTKMNRWRRIYEILYHNVEFNLIAFQHQDKHGLSNILPGIFALALELQHVLSADIILRYALVANIDVFKYPCYDSDAKLKYLMYELTPNQKKTITKLSNYKISPLLSTEINPEYIQNSDKTRIALHELQQTLS